VSDDRSAIQDRWRLELGQAATVIDGIRGSLDQVERIADALVGALAAGGCIFTCGNGGSALAAQHFTAELVAHFRRERPPVRGVALTADAGLLTAIANDHDFDQIFSRQVRGLLTSRDVLLAFSTSGRSPNVLAAVRAACDIGAMTVAFTGGEGGQLAPMVDHALIVRESETARIQEGHLILIHLICEHIDAAFSPDRVHAES
jgi:D-sedoheptulose 7-phosphate isomerase